MNNIQNYEMTNYKSPNFSAKKINPNDVKRLADAVGVGAGGIVLASYVTQDKGMSAEELGGRTQLMGNPINPNPEVFNKEVSFYYFANGKLKNVPEYVETGRKNTAQLDDYQKNNKLNTLKYQERIVDKILSEDALINNEGIRKYLYYMINNDYNYSVPDTKEETQNMMNYYDTKSQALIKVLDAYAQKPEMQQNPYINQYINDYARNVRNDEQADFLIELLTQNVANKDKQFYDNLDGLIRSNIDSNLISKVQSDKRLYDKLGSSVLYNIDGTKKEVADKVIQVLDDYLANYTDSKLVSEKISNVVWESFAYEQKEDPVKFATKMMQDMVAKEKATKSETADAFCKRINAKLDDVIAGKYYDKDKSPIDNVNMQIDMIRELRAEIKDAASKYTDEKSKEALNWTLGTVIHGLEMMKQVRERMGWATLGYADITDKNINDEISEMLKINQK